MIDYIKNIINNKKCEVAVCRRKRPLKILRQQAAEAFSRRSFFNALEKPGPAGVNIIAEIKRASPSKGLLCPQLNPATVATQYQEGGAAALSVLTDKTFFQGSLADLQAARAACRLPVLRKDFLVSSYQIYESAAAGADAVLLIVRALSDRQLCEYLALCRDLSLDALVEVYAAEELEMATAAGAQLIGINNRNLASFDTDISHAISLAHRLGRDQVLVAASGITGRADVEKNISAGIYNLLIGESLVKSADPVAMLQTLRGEIA